KIKFFEHFVRGVSSSRYAGNRLFFLSAQNKPGPVFREVMSSIDLSTHESWAIKINNAKQDFNSSSIFDLDAVGNLIIANGVDTGNHAYLHPNVIELFKLAPNGDMIWKKGLRLSINGQPHGNLVKVFRIGANSSNEILLLGYFATNSIFNKGPAFVIKLDEFGNPVKYKLLKNSFYFDMKVEDDGIFLWDKNPDIPFIYQYPPYIDTSSLRLVRLDSDLNFLWGKKYDAEKFHYMTGSLARTGNDRLALAHTTYGYYPVILSELDNNGNILSQKGYPNYQPVIYSLGEGSLVMASPVDSNFSIANPIFAKTDTNGEIAGCVTLPTCLRVEDTAIEFDVFEVDTIECLRELELLPPMEITPSTVNFTPYCDYPPIPTPEFGFPDTLCTGSPAITTGGGSRYAQAREWHLTGPGTDSLLRDSFEFRYTFNTPGEYLLRQTIWVLGCAHSHERSVTVLPPLSVTVSADSLVCPGEQVSIMAEASRAASYLWSNGQTGQTPFATASGTYAVTATDGHCEASDSASVTVVAELLGNNNPPFTLPPDTTSCLPYLLTPQSLFTDQFYTDTDPTATASFLLETPGSYRIGMSAFGCEFWELYEFGVDCHVDVYLPTSFSPNGDGINDVFQPYGSNFEVLELNVFDRWGGLRYKGKSWDGGTLGQGLYVYTLHYKNLRSGEEAEMNGEVLLLK
ncbi:MAG: gliding motility-associated C-terminal domain-containing protein, partial [Saprospiraceae bacterium]|nr:gliding motility-associated C-terminal domain-containing protein [Saprospiraceae bacterium]